MNRNRFGLQQLLSITYPVFLYIYSLTELNLSLKSSDPVNAINANTPLPPTDNDV